MPSIVVSRRVGEEEIGAISRLAAEAESFDKHKALGDHAWLDLVHGGRKGVFGFTARLEGTLHLLGYAQLSAGNSTWELEMVVHPLHRSRKAGVSEALLRRSLREIAANGGGHVHIWLSHNDHDMVELLQGAGFRRGRELIQMRRRLPLERDLIAEPIETRPFVCGQDEAEWLRANNLAFARHPEQGGWTLDTLSSRQQEPWFDPEGFLLHFEHNRLAAFCWTKIHADTDPVMGEIYVIGVDPELGGKGLGRRMCVAGLEHLARKRLPVAMLYVDSDNAAALAMYEHLGFHPNHVDTAYVADVEPEAPVGVGN
ncbi:MAG: mycothiol synthase [Actinomycetota bacterium]|nr:mycothiol synthase [Actinomycetota bacterium]